MQKHSPVRLEQEVDHKPNASRRGAHVTEHDHSLVAERHQNMTEIDVLLKKTSPQNSNQFIVFTGRGFDTLLTSPPYKVDSAFIRQRAVIK